MSSEAKIAANRRNAGRSTGPQTPRGKATVSRNAIKHGLASRDIVLPEEDAEEFHALLEAFRSEHQPQTAFEACLVAQMAAAEWRLRRVCRIEKGLFVDSLAYVRESHHLNPPKPLSRLSAAEREYADNTRLLGRVFARDCSEDAFDKLLRYDNRMRRAFYKALSELRLAQSRRPSPPAPPPREPEPAPPVPQPTKMTNQSQICPPGGSPVSRSPAATSPTASEPDTPVSQPQRPAPAQRQPEAPIPPPRRLAANPVPQPTKITNQSQIGPPEGSRVSPSPAALPPTASGPETAVSQPQRPAPVPPPPEAPTPPLPTRPPGQPSVCPPCRSSGETLSPLRPWGRPRRNRFCYHKTLRVGIHTSISGSLEKAALRAAELGANTFQIFSSSPRMWRARRPDPDGVKRLRQARERLDLRPLVIHDNYLINLAAAEPALREQSIAAYRGEVERALIIGAEYLVAHPGSYGSLGVEKGICTMVESLIRATRGLKSGTLTLLIENTAGGGTRLGGCFEELHAIRELGLRYLDFAVGYCIDTAHCLASGYDVSSAEGLKNTVRQAEKILGLAHVKVIHANDSKTPFGSRCLLSSGRLTPESVPRRPPYDYSTSCVWVGRGGASRSRASERRRSPQRRLGSSGPQTCVPVGQARKPSSGQPRRTAAGTLHAKAGITPDGAPSARGPCP